MGRSRHEIGQIPLDEYVDAVASIYSTHDGKRSIWDVWCHTLHHAAAIAEQIRRHGPNEKLHTEIADFSLWLFTAILKLKGKFGQSEGRAETPQESVIRIQSSCADLIWHKYPKLCPTCFANETVAHEKPGHLNICECPAQRAENENDDTRRKRTTAVRHYSEGVRNKKPSGVDEWQEMFGAIFAKNLATLSPSDIALHIMEELGEASDAMVRMYTYSERNFIDEEPNWRQSDLEGELADVFSWLFALVNKLDTAKAGIQKDRDQDSRPAAVSTESVRLSGIIWDRYGSDSSNSFCCRKCKGIVCNCQIILVPNTHSIEMLVQKFRQAEDGIEPLRKEES